MKKKIIRLTESDLNRIVENTVKRIINENVIDGSYDIPYGFHVEIDSSYSTVAIDDPDDEENSYYLQGDDANDLIKEICRYWESSGNVSQEEAVNTVISGLF